MKQLNQVLLCRPDHFEVTYQINPWMQVGAVNTLKAQQQWQNLRQTLELLDISVEIIPQQPGVPDMVFAVDQGIVQDQRVLLASFHHPERQVETQYYHQWFSDHGYQVHTTTGSHFEGGEYLAWKSLYFVGTGFRTESAAIPVFEDFVKTEVISLELVDPQFYHLDMCLLPLSEKQVMYYPPAFSPASQQVLQQRVPELIELTAAEAALFGANCLVIDRTVLLSAINPTLSATLSSLGYQPLTVDVSEFRKAGGGIHCLVMPLSYQPQVATSKESYDRTVIRQSI
jgi:N-dimethylarginine dimethylaminohydrolase